MPAKSEKQRQMIFAKRNQYKSKENTPEDWKWIWNDDWTKVKKESLPRYKRYQEWDPKRFELERQKGVLDKTNLPKHLPPFVLSFINRMHKGIDFFTHGVWKNKILPGQSRVVIYQNNFYSSNNLIHIFILVYLIIKEGLMIDEDTLLEWGEVVQTDFLCLQLTAHHIYLSESYDKKMIKKMNMLINKNAYHFKDTLNKIIKMSGKEFVPNSYTILRRKPS